MCLWSLLREMLFGSQHRKAEAQQVAFDSAPAGREVRHAFGVAWKPAAKTETVPATNLTSLVRSKGPRRRFRPAVLSPRFSVLQPAELTDRNGGTGFFSSVASARIREAMIFGSVRERLDMEEV